jgi:GT2 family glycosyltransferase
MYEIIMADNASTDGSVEYVKQNFPWVKIVSFNKNLGFAEGNNCALRYANGKYIGFLNPDAEVDENWLAELVNCMERNPEVASCGGKVLYLRKRDVIQNAGHKMTLIGIPYPIGDRERDKGLYERERYTLAASGCAMLVRKDVFEKVGGFDKDYFLYVEEGDLGLRLWIYGYKVMYVPKAKAYHELSAWAKSEITPKHVFFYQKNIIATIIKNFELKNCLKGLCLLLIYDLVKFTYFVWNKKLDHAREILRGLKCAVKELPRNLLKRRMIQKNRKISDKRLFTLGLIMTINESFEKFIRMHFEK